ncbi:MAG: sigma-70 family RNA polymerase sigma factor [Planctomycetes bacterium]|nr:sigma-70 family RNA polymerase sigma factor [Planctomycetota bacterium]
MDDRTARLRLLAEQQPGESASNSSAELLALLYEELRDLARARLAKLPPGQTLQATDLVHETYARIQGREPGGWEGRRHFFFAAARSMRDILLEAARRQSRKRRHLGTDRLTLAGIPLEDGRSWADLLALDEALDTLEQNEPDNFKIVLLRYFAGLDMSEVADATGLSVSTVKRKWAYIRAWLLRAVDGRRGSPTDE